MDKSTIIYILVLFISLFTLSQLILDNKKQCDNICETKGGVRTNKVLVLKTDMCGCLIDNHLELVEME